MGQEESAKPKAGKLPPQPAVGDEGVVSLCGTGGCFPIQGFQARLTAGNTGTALLWHAGHLHQWDFWLISRFSRLFQASLTQSLRPLLPTGCSSPPPAATKGPLYGILAGRCRAAATAAPAAESLQWLVEQSRPGWAERPAATSSWPAPAPPVHHAEAPSS